MPLTAIDPQSALVVVDLQKGILGLDLAHPVEDVVEKSAALASAYRAKGLPVVLVNVAGGAPGRTDQSQAAAARPTPPADWTDLAPELDAQPGDILVTKKTWGAFTGATLHDELTSLGVTQVVLTGVATSIGVESTARFAHELGYHVVLATDAMTDGNPDAHQNSVERIFPRLGETATTDEILATLGSAATAS